jgi:hypothetical protein
MKRTVAAALSVKLTVVPVFFAVMLAPLDAARKRFGESERPLRRASAAGCGWGWGWAVIVSAALL